MYNKWTGGQYSLYRAMFGLLLLLQLLDLAWSRSVLQESGLIPLSGSLAVIVNNPGGFFSLLALSILAALGFISGFYDKSAAIFLALSLCSFYFAAPVLTHDGIPVFAFILICHCLLPSAPYGSIKAIGRTDPGDGWCIRNNLYEIFWLLTATIYSFYGFSRFFEAAWLQGDIVSSFLSSSAIRQSWLSAALNELPPGIRSVMGWVILFILLLQLPLSFVRKIRPLAWLLLVYFLLFLMLLSKEPGLPAALLMLQLFIADPGWLRGEADKTMIFYDGDCGLCHGAVRFVLAEDSYERFHFSPLQSDYFEKQFSDKEKEAFPDSIILKSGDKIYTESEAVRQICLRLGGCWTIAGWFMAICPKVLRDSVYRLIARIRRKIFKKPDDACPMMPPELRERFEA